MRQKTKNEKNDPWNSFNPGKKPCASPPISFQVTLKLIPFSKLPDPFRTLYICTCFPFCLEFPLYSFLPPSPQFTWETAGGSQEELIITFVIPSCSPKVWCSFFCFQDTLITSLLQRLHKLWPVGQIRPTSAFVNKVLLEQSHTHLFTYCPRLLSYPHVGTEQIPQRLQGQQT